MKIVKSIFTLIIILLFSIGVSAQNPPDPPGGHGEENDQEPGGSAPVDGGVFMLLGLGALYAGKKVYELKTAEEVDD